MLVLSAIVAFVVPTHAWWGQLIFGAAVLWFCITGWYLWSLRKGSHADVTRTSGPDSAFLRRLVSAVEIGLRHLQREAKEEPWSVPDGLRNWIEHKQPFDLARNIILDALKGNAQAQQAVIDLMAALSHVLSIQTPEGEMPDDFVRTLVRDALNGDAQAQSRLAEILAYLEPI